MANKTIGNISDEYTKELKAFDDTKSGVKGLVDGGVVNIPRIFIRPPEDLKVVKQSHHFQVPVIDLQGIDRDELQRKQVVNDIKIAAEKWGFFQVVNHSIPLKVMNEMIDGVNRFHEMRVEEKMEFYTRDPIKNVRFTSNYDLFMSRNASWRDTMTISVSDHLDPVDLPVSCRTEVIEYIKHVTKLGDTLFEILSESLELESNYLKNLECANTCRLTCHYYPACPEPDRTLGCNKHTDAAFLTILLQNQINGLQIRYGDSWVNINPVPGGLAVNVGDLLQLISNDKYKSIEHRVTANLIGPRVSVACFFLGPSLSPKLYGPIKELISEENPPLYKEIRLNEYANNVFSRGLEEKINLDFYKL